MRRPTGIVLLATFMGFAAVLLPLGAFVLPSASDLFLGGLWGLVILAVGAALAAVGLWRGTLAGWAAALAVHVFQGAQNLVKAEGAAVLEVAAVLLVPALVVGYLFTPEARRWCGLAPRGA